MNDDYDPNETWSQRVERLRTLDEMQRGYGKYIDPRGRDEWGDKYWNDRPKKRIKSKPVDGTTWMVSVIHPNFPGGSTYVSQRAGKTAKQAAESYLSDPDNVGTELANEDPEMTLICVIDPTLLMGMKTWKIYLFAVEKKDGKLITKEFV